MKKFFYLVSLIPLLLLACTREAVQEEGSVQFAKIHVSIDNASQPFDGGTRTVVNIANYEKFVKAALFAFDPDGNILVNNSGNTSYSVAIESNDPDFDWDLPLNQPMKIYVLENYGSLDLTSYLNNKSLKVSDLEALTFSCGSSAQLQALESSGNGIPMSGVNSTTITSPSQVLDITVGKLFARYDFRVNLSYFQSCQYNVSGVYIRAQNSNTEVPYFSEGSLNGGTIPSGFKQDSPGKFECIDEGSAANNDLVNLLENDPGKYVTLYFLENCQGHKYPSGTTPASSWKTVYSDFDDAGKVSELDKCSYIEIMVEMTDPVSNKPHTVYQRVYVGDDMRNDNTSNFNVRRNVYQQLSLNLNPDEMSDPEGENYFEDRFTKSFLFDHSKTYTVSQGYSVVVPFGYKNIKSTNLGFSERTLKLNTGNVSTQEAQSISLYQSFDRFRYKSSGSVSVSASASTPVGSYTLVGGELVDVEDGVTDEILINVVPNASYRVEIRFWRGSSPAQVGEKIYPRAALMRYVNGALDWSYSFPETGLPYRYLNEDKWSVIAGQNVSIGNDGVGGYVTSSQETVGVIRASDVAPDGRTYYSDFTVEFTRSNTYELRIIKRSEDTGFNTGGIQGHSSISADATVNGYIELCAYMYKVNNGIDLERTNVSASSVWEVCDHLTGQVLDSSPVVVSQSGSGGSAYIRLRSSQVGDYRISASYDFNNFGYTTLEEFIPVTWTSSGGGGGTTDWVTRYITFSLVQLSTGTNVRYKVVASESVPCDVTVTVTYNTSNRINFTVASGNTESSASAIRGLNPHITATDPSSFTDNSAKIYYEFTFSN